MPTKTRSVENAGKTVCIEFFNCASEVEERLPSGRLLLLKDKVSAALNIVRKTAKVENFSTRGFDYKLEVTQYAETKVSIAAYASYYFRTAEDRAMMEQFLEPECSDVDVCVAGKCYDVRLFDLCVLLPNDWFGSDANTRELAALLYIKSAANKPLARRTFMSLLRVKLGDAFAFDAAQVLFDQSAGKSLSLTEDGVQAIAREAGTDAYKDWRAEQVAEEAVEATKREALAKQQKEAKAKAAAAIASGDWKEWHDAKEKLAEKKKMTQKELKAALFEVILDELKRLPKDLIRADNGLFTNGVSRTRNWESAEELAYAIKSIYANINNDNKPEYLKKTERIVRFSRNDPVRVITYSWSLAMGNNCGERRVKFLVRFMGQVVKVTLQEILDECYTGIDYDIANVIPHSPLESHDNGLTFNLFGQYQHTYDPKFVINQKLVDLWVNHIKFIICSGDPKLYEYLLSWFAHLLQNPGTKTQTVPLMKSKPGAGKNFFVNVFARYVLNPTLATVTNDLDRLTGRFNSMSSGKILVFIDEALDTGNRKGQQIMKNKITEDKQNLERKGMDIIEVDDFCNYIIATNNDFSSIVEAYDRRYMCIEVSDRVCPGMPEHDEYWARMKALYTNEAGLHIFHWLLQRDLSKFECFNLPETTYKKELKFKQSNVVVRYLLHKRRVLIEHNDEGRLQMTDKQMYDDFKVWCEETNHKEVNDDVFKSLVVGLGFKLVQCRVPGSTQKPRFRILSQKLIGELLDQYIVDEAVEEADAE